MAADRDDEKPAVTVGQAVLFTFTDELFGTELEQAGVVLAIDDELVTVAPVAPMVIQVSAAAVGPLPEPAEADS